MDWPGQPASRLFVLSINDFDGDGNEYMKPIRIFLNPDDAIDFYSTTSNVRPAGNMQSARTFAQDLNMLRNVATTAEAVFFRDDSEENDYMLKLTRVVGNMYGGRTRNKARRRSRSTRRR
jgi:hypothetical protein